MLKKKTKLARMTSPVLILVLCCAAVLINGVIVVEIFLLAEKGLLWLLLALCIYLALLLSVLAYVIYRKEVKSISARYGIDEAEVRKQFRTK